MQLHEQPALPMPQARLLRATDALAVRFTGVFGKETVDQCAFDSRNPTRQPTDRHQGHVS